MTTGFLSSKILAAADLETDFQHSEPCQACLGAKGSVTHACEVERYLSRGSAGPVLPLLAGLFALLLAFLLTLAARA